MGIRINHNISSINTQRRLEKISMATSKTLEHLSSGQRINSAADGPASLVISENMRAQISGLNQAIENSENGISMVQTAEGALSEVNRLLVDIRQLAIHASNEGAQDALKLIDQAIQETTDERGKLGAFQKNTLQSNLSNLRISAENMTAAESVIRDSDMAAEMADFTKNQIMMQTTIAMLAQANQGQQTILSLLK